MAKASGLMNIDFREIELSDKFAMEQWATMLGLYSWGVDYPVRPMDEIVKAEYIVGAFGPNGMGGKELYGAACINRFANNDGKSNRDMWFSGWVVHPDERRHGIGQRLHDMCVNYAGKSLGKLRASSETEYMDNFFLTHGWSVTEGRETARNEAGQPMMLYVFGFGLG